MQSALEAYSQTAKVAEAPRQLEASLLLKSAAQLQDMQDNWPEDKSAIEAVLHYNRRLWTVFVGSVSSEECELPMEVRNNIASLGVFVFKQTLDVQFEPKPEKLVPLININREIAAGLNAQAT